MISRFRKGNESYSSFGFSSILLMFVMICIVTFSVLALLTANADYKLSQKVAKTTSEYYQAEETAYLVMADIDTILATSYGQSLLTDKNPEDYFYQTAKTKLEAYDTLLLTLSEEENKLIISYQIPITSNQTLQVELAADYPKNQAQGFFSIESWIVITTEEEGNTSLPVLQ